MAMPVSTNCHKLLIFFFVKGGVLKKKMSRRAFVKQSMVGKLANKRRLAQRAQLQAYRAAFRQPGVSRQAIMRVTNPRAHFEIKAVDSQGGAGCVFDFLTAGTVYNALAATSAAPTLGNPVEGSSFYNRIGRRIRMKSLQITGTIRPSNGNAAAVPDQFGRLLVIYDRQPNGALPSLADIITNYDEAGTTGSTAHAGINLNNRSRFVVLRDRRFYLPPLGINGATPAAQQGVTMVPTDDTSFLFREFIKLGGLETQYKASTATGPIGDISTGSLIIATVSTADANATSAWRFTGNVRLRFED